MEATFEKKDNIDFKSGKVYRTKDVLLIYNPNFYVAVKNRRERIRLALKVLFVWQ
jgi:hypothetical protein